ncbi:tyrosine-type recombinase/integrase [Luteimonas sp. 3794]|uniref:tyrosine-type recombinase/integrase n=1 Tax=Luteimonas sp. 3794 TaxID=2817730 RepID=UPI00286356FF|nr:tyrosine-type recombinase/integrase [Luteimonas sp. 3794]MDR6992854.1 site-specific recombinase XerD [Luteimonas sp. 3794]
MRQVKEVRNARMPTPEAFRKIYDYAKAGSELQPREKGRQPPYLWAAMELAFQACLRRIEVITLHDGQVTEVLADASSEAVELLKTRRRKGSRDNQVRIGSRMREAIAALQAHRATIWARKGFATPIRPEQRALFVSEDGTPLTRDGFKSSWGKMMRAALKAGIIAPEDRFAMHGLKHRGITDTKGTGADKKHAAGHVTDSMANLYNHDLPMVEPADD